MTSRYLRKLAYEMDKIQNIADESSDDEGFEVDESEALEVNGDEVDSIETTDDSGLFFISSSELYIILCYWIIGHR